MGGTLGKLQTDPPVEPQSDISDDKTRDSLIAQYSMLQCVSVFAGKTGVEGSAPDDVKAALDIEDVLFRFPIGCCFYPVHASSKPQSPSGFASKLLSKFTSSKGNADSAPKSVFQPDQCLIVSDTQNGVVRCITPTGKVYNISEKRPENLDVLGIETLTFKEPSPCVYDPLDHSVLVPDALDHAIRRIRLDFDGSAELQGFTVENIYSELESITAGDENKIKMVKPWGIALDPSNPGYFFVSDSLNHCIRKYYIKSKKYELLSGSYNQRGYQDGEKALFDSPRGMMVLGDKLWICDNKNSCIRLMDLKTGVVRTISGNPNSMNNQGDLEEGKKFGEMTWKGPKFVTVDNLKRILIVDSGCNFLRILTPPAGTTFLDCDLNDVSVRTYGVGMNYESILTTFADNKRTDIPSQAFFNPGSVAVDTWNNFYIADQSSHRIIKYQYGLEIKESRLSILLGSKDPHSKVAKFIDSPLFDAYIVSLIFTFCGRK
jgi:hypothetical protein